MDDRVDDRTTATEAAARRLAEAWLTAAMAQNADALLALYADDALVIGAGPDEWYEGHDALARGLAGDWAQPQELTATLDALTARPIAPDAACFAVTFRMETATEPKATIPARLSGVARRAPTGGGWQMVHSHMSIPPRSVTDPQAGR